MIKTTNMKKVLFLLVSVLFVLGGYAQNLPIDDMRLAGENHESLKVIYINKDVSTHFVLWRTSNMWIYRSEI